MAGLTRSGHYRLGVICVCYHPVAARDDVTDVEMNDLILETPSIDQLARIIGNVAAPAFLLGAVASFISVLISRINHVIDRSQYLHGIDDGDAVKSYLKSDIPRLKRRAVLLNRSLFCAIFAAILTALIIIVAFISAYYHVAHEYGVAILFVGALVTFLRLADRARA